MNNRIKELALECYNPYSNFDHEKFAKLIIDDVINIMSDPITYNRCVHTNFDMNRAQCIVADIIKKINEDLL